MIRSEQGKGKITLAAFRKKKTKKPKPKPTKPPGKIYLKARVFKADTTKTLLVTGY